MRGISKGWVLGACLTLAVSPASGGEIGTALQPWRAAAVALESLAGRLAPPPGYQRLPADSQSFAHWLRQLPLRPPGAPASSSMMAA